MRMRMKVTRQEIDCLARLFEIGPYMEEIVEYFVLEGIMKKEDVPFLKTHPDRAKYLQGFIARARESNLLLMADFEWQILPYERIRIYCVTARLAKEFLYSNA